MSARVSTALLLGAALALFAPAPAHAAHHLLKIVEVYAGSAGHDNVEFVEVMAPSAGENLTSGDKVQIFDNSGAVVRTATIPVNVANSANQMSILLATNEAKAYFGISAADGTFSAGIPAIGKACFVTDTNTVLDCVSWGAYTGPTTTTGDVSPVAGGIPAGKSLQRNIDRGAAGVLEATADDANSSSVDFAATARVTPRTNGGAVTSKATTATVDGATTQLNVQAAVGVKNVVDAVKTTNVTLSDGAAPVTPNAGCSGVDVDTVTCTGATYTDIRSEDLADKITISGFGGRLDGGSGDDRLTGAALGDDLLGGTGNDILVGGAGGDDLLGFDGIDLLDGGTGRDTMAGGDGVDTASYATRVGAVNLSLDATANDGSSADEELGLRDDIQSDVENLTGGNGADVLTGNLTANTFDGGKGADQIDGGPGGVNTVTYVKRTAAVTVDLNLAVGGNADDGVGDSFIAIKNVIGGAAADTLRGSDLVNRIEGKGGADTIDARNGNDTVLIDDAIADGTVTCGGGTDRFRADAIDVTTSCETPI